MDHLLSESPYDAGRLGERLTGQISEDVFPGLAKGFIAHLRHLDGAATELSQARLDAVFRGTLALLYRLLFLLYAEARGLLPAPKRCAYPDESLSRLTAEVARVGGSSQEEAPKRLARGFSADPATTALYDRLLDLARIVGRGDAPTGTLGNSGLFGTAVEPDDRGPEVEAARFLLQYKIPDRYLALALDRLARDVDQQRGRLVPIDYRSRDVRQLGAIHESLVELRLRRAPEKMAIVKGKKTEDIIPYREATRERRAVPADGRGRHAPERTLPEGAIYLENDRRGRKATGCYYTPDHIVRYLVEHAVGPALEEHLERLRPRFRAAQRAYRAAQERQAPSRQQGRRGGDAPDTGADDPRCRGLVDALFSFRVLDPAIGSGQFLVATVDFIADRMLDFLSAFPRNPVEAHLRQTRERTQSEMERQGAPIDAGKLTDANLLRRQVLKRCIYGVDLDPMAVELAKMTLWLRCSTPGAPLPFLDHHLRCGNALIGTRVEEVERELELPGQRSVRRAGERAQLVLAARLMRRIGELPDLTASQVRESRAELRRATETVASAKVLLDLFTSRWFGNEPRRVGRGQGARIDDSAMEFLRGEEANRWLRAGCGAALLAGTDRELVERGLAVAADRRFFHWEIEFPDAFCGPREETSQALGQLEGAGFDAVIGNPPWGATMGPALRAWCRERFPSIGRGETDHFAAFLDVALRLTRHGGRVGLLLPDILLLKNYPHARHRLLTQLQLSDLVHWGQPFAAVNLDVCSVVGQRVTAPDPQQPVRCIVDVADWGRGEYATNLIEQGRFLTNKEFRFNLYLHPGLQGCLDRIRRRSHPLGEFLEFHEGIHSGNMRSKLFVDEDDGRACRRLILRGDEVSPFRIGWAGKWVRYDRAIVDRAAGEYANLGHVHYFTSPKLLVRRTGDRLLAAFDDAQFFASNNFFVALVRGGTGVPLCGLEALLNARLATWFFRAIQPRTGRLFAEVKITHLEDLPVPQALTASDWAWLESQARDIRSLLMAGEQSAPEEVARLRSQIDRCLLDALGISWGDLKRALPVGCSWALPRRSPYGAPADKIR